MSALNYSIVSVLTSDEVIMIKGIFSDTGTYGDKPKEYTFKTTDKNLKKDDFVVVQCAGQSAHYGLAVVKITQVNVPVEVSCMTVQKWVVGKIDMVSHQLLLDAEEALVEKVKTAQRVNKKQQLLAALGIDTTESLKLSDFRNKL